MKSAVAPGGSTNVTGVLLVHGEGGQPGHVVTLEAKPQGTDEFVPIAEATTREHGGLRVTVTPSTSTRYRWHYAGDELTRPSVSGIARVGVRTPDHPATRLNTTLAIRLSHRVVAPGAETTVHGRLATHRVAVRNRWVVLVSRTPDAEAWAFEDVAQTGPDGRVAFAVAPGGPTAYRLAFLGTPTAPAGAQCGRAGRRPADGHHRRDADRPRPRRYHDRLRHRQHGSRPGRRRPGAAARPAGRFEERSRGRRHRHHRERRHRRDRRDPAPLAVLPAPRAAHRGRAARDQRAGPRRRTRSHVTVGPRPHLADAYVVSGVLRGGGGTLANREVALLAQAPGTTEWVQVDTALTGPHGMARFTQPLAPGTAYQLSFAGGPRLAPCVSGVVSQ